MIVACMHNACLIKKQLNVLEVYRKPQYFRMRRYVFWTSHKFPKQHFLFKLRWQRGWTGSCLSGSGDWQRIKSIQVTSRKMPVRIVTELALSYRRVRPLHLAMTSTLIGQLGSWIGRRRRKALGLRPGSGHAILKCPQDA